MTAIALTRLLQLVSPALPVGAFAYSQGLEWVVEAGWVRDEASAMRWIEAALDQTVARVDLPILARLIHAWSDHDDARRAYWNAELRAWRETAELRAEERDRARALARLLAGLDVPRARELFDDDTLVYATPYALACAHWKIARDQALLGYAWSWLENTTINAVKLVPLGQMAGQRLLSRFVPVLHESVMLALSLDDAAIGGTLPAAAVASSRHETQYTRLFRS